MRWGQRNLNFHSPKWLGFKKDDLEFGYDLWEKDIRNIVIHSLYNPSRRYWFAKSILSRLSHVVSPILILFIIILSKWRVMKPGYYTWYLPGLVNVFDIFNLSLRMGQGSDNSKPWMFVKWSGSVIGIAWLNPFDLFERPFSDFRYDLNLLGWIEEIDKSLFWVSFTKNTKRPILQ